MKQESFEAKCEDGVKLRGILLIPDTPKAVIQFNCGTGVKKEIYLPFLKYLTESNYLCCLWDNRDSGDSAPTDLKNCDYTYSDYGIKDMPTIKRYLNANFPNLPFFIVAHSAGGQQIGFMDDLNNIVGIVNFAVSTGFYSNMPLAYRLKAYFFFYIFAPISSYLTGYVAGKKFGLMENLPKRVIYEWRSWCSKEDYFFDKKFYGKTVPEGNFDKFNIPIHVFWTTDDTISNEKNIKNFWKNVKSTHEISFTRIIPEELDLKSIGHLGFFKKNLKDTVWSDTAKILDKLLQEKNDI